MTLEKSESDVEVASRVSQATVSKAGTDADLEAESGTALAEDEGPEIEQLLPNTNIVTHCIYKNDPQRFIRLVLWQLYYNQLLYSQVVELF